MNAPDPIDLTAFKSIGRKYSGRDYPLSAIIAAERLVLAVEALEYLRERALTRTPEGAVADALTLAAEAIRLTGGAS